MLYPRRVWLVLGPSVPPRYRPGGRLRLILPIVNDRACQGFLDVVVLSAAALALQQRNDLFGGLFHRLAGHVDDRPRITGTHDLAEEGQLLCDLVWVGVLASRTAAQRFQS